MKVTTFNCGPFANASERKAVEHLKHRLISISGDSDWILLSNLSFSADHRKQAAEIDIVAIGPPGVRVIEVKHWSTRWINRNQDSVEHEADKVANKARKIGTTLRERVRSGLGRVDGIFLVTQARSKVKGLTNRSVKGVPMYTLDQWREALDLDAREVLSGAEVRKLAEALDPKASVALDGSLRRLAGYVDLSLQTPVAERFHRAYRATHASRRERAILHLYDLSAVDEGAETKARREFEALRRVQRHKWAPRIRDSYQDAPGYAGEMAFFTIDDPAAPSLSQRKADASWGTAERLDFALQALGALVELHTETSGGEPLVHRRISPETVLVRHDNRPMLTGFDLAKIPEHSTVAASGATQDIDTTFVAPEILEQGLSAADHRTDIYQLCATLAELFSDRADETSRSALGVLGGGIAALPQDRADLHLLVRGLRELRGEQVSSPPPPPAEFWTAEQVVRFGTNDYEIVERLGQGGIGIAFKVVKLDPQAEKPLGPYVAKVVLEAPTGHAVFKSYRLVHPHLRHTALSTIFEVAPKWRENSILALLTWIEGEPVNDYLGVLSLVAEERSEGDTETCLLDWFRELCEALAVLHRNDLVHGDISPGNLILTDDKIVLTDYDLVTQIGCVAFSVGTSLYCSPSRSEQCPVEPSDDFYALAASLFHALFGNKPFQYGGNREKERGLNWEGIDTAALPVVRRFLDRATDPKSERRYTSADEALADLRVSAARNPRHPSKHRSPSPQAPRVPNASVQAPRQTAVGGLDYDSHRQRLVDWLRSQLVGPARRDTQTLVGIAPWERYPSGMLYPIERGVSGLDPADTSAGISVEAGQSREDSEDESATNDGAESRSLAKSARRRRYVPPSSVGFSFFVRGSARLVITVCAATYRRIEERDSSGQFQKLRYERTPVEPKTLEWDGGRFLDVLGDERFGVDVRPRDLAGGSVFTVTCYNRQEIGPGDFGPRQSQSLSEKSLFEVQLECEIAAGVLSEHPRVDPHLLSEEEQELELQYRDRKIYAVGHGSGVNWETADGRNRIWTEHLPSTKVPLVNTTPEVAGDQALRLDFLSTNRRESVVPCLETFIEGYADWIASQPMDALDEAQQAAADRLLKRMDHAVRRMRGGVALLDSDAKVYESFRLANRSMLDQLRQSNQIRNKDVDSSELKWRPFQLAFLLTVLESTVREEDPSRDLLDLIWFPTGGGKTEAYLGLTAFVIVWRRLVHGDSGAGTSVLMRYTLRLLTRQQFDRSTRFIFALELIRRSAPETLGHLPISAGIWIGKKTSPNSFKQAKKLADEIKGTTGPNGLVVDACPWCDAKFDERNYRATDNKFQLYCISPDCEFGRSSGVPLPCNVVDDALYDEPPSLLISTIDKFARLPWTSRAGAFFGDGTRRPPELVIQDELHLITGPLGSVAGLYEAGLETLLQVRGVRPKYVASTATIRMAKGQVRRLYGRNLAVFPPAGISCDDCYFACTQDGPGRLYVGYLARMLDQRHCLAPLAAALLAAPLELFRDQADKDALLEAWWTQVVYHSSLRSVTDSSNAYTVGVSERIRRLVGESTAIAKEAASERNSTGPRDSDVDTLWERIDKPRIKQLTSRAIPKDIAQTFSRLKKNRDDADHLDVVLSTNMVSVGLDVSRLALMVICGQPLTTAEYIQASSRVGRADVPGLVVANYFRHQARSLAHYENFRPYHESFYRFVEPTSVTPFTHQVRQRALHAALVVALRHGCDHLRENNCAGQLSLTDPRVRQAIATLKRRCCDAAEEKADEVVEHIERLLEEWCQEIERLGKRDLCFRAQDGGADGLLKGHDDARSGLWETLPSMRNVENTAALVARWR